MGTSGRPDRVVQGIATREAETSSVGERRMMEFPWSVVTREKTRSQGESSKPELGGPRRVLTITTPSGGARCCSRAAISGSGRRAFCPAILFVLSDSFTKRKPCTSTRRNGTKNARKIRCVNHVVVGTPEHGLSFAESQGFVPPEQRMTATFFPAVLHIAGFTPVSSMTTARRKPR